MASNQDTSSQVQSHKLAGLPDMRYYPAYRLAAWQPQGVLDDFLLDQIAEWTVATEKLTAEPFNRFVDLGRLTEIKLQIGHIFSVARERALNYTGPTPIKSAFYCDKMVGFGIARLYETLLEGSMIAARAFHNRRTAAEWLGVPFQVLQLTDVPIDQV